MSTEHHAYTRRFIRTKEPIWPFVWRGLIPLLLLLLLFGYGCTRFASHDIEKSVNAQVSAALNARGLNWVDVDVDGQKVVLKGVVPFRTSIDGKTSVTGIQSAAIALAEAARCDTWAGMKTCAISVEAKFTQPKSPRAPAKSPRAPVKPTVKTVWLDLQTAVEGKTIVLTGEVPSAALKQQLGALATTRLAPPRLTSVRNDLVVVAKKTPAAFNQAAERTVRIAAQCLRGYARIKSGAFTVACDVAGKDLSRIKTEANRTIDGGEIGPIRLLAAEAVAACEQGLADLMKTASIKFRTGSAVISKSSNTLLDKAAAAAKACPGVLQIEGHTDSQGSVETNSALSLNRASAVKAEMVKRGLSADSLVARGFGPNRPAATNETAAGRAQNRRIEFHVKHEK